MAVNKDEVVSHPALHLPIPPMAPLQNHSAELSPENLVTKMIGGVCVAEGTYPWTVAIVDPFTGQGKGLYCGGSIVNERWVVTASHCVKGKHLERVSISAGSTSLKHPVQTRGVIKVICHEGYDADTHDNDIALLELDEGLDLSLKTEGPIAVLPASEEKSYASPKTIATVLGWGNTDASNPDSISDKLREADEPIRTNQECKNAYPDRVVTDNMICAGLDQGGKGHCVRDSGGPLVVPTSHGWTDEQYGSAPNGWYVGDFNDDGKDDIFRYCPPDHPCGNLASGAQVFLSRGSKFEDAGSWTDEQFGSAPNGWYVGDFNGDRKDDIMRYCSPDHPCGNLASGAQVFLSTGSKFNDAGSWTSEEYGSAPNGWYIGDFNGDGKDDIFRYCPPDHPCGNVVSGAQVLLSTGSKFENAGSWTDEQFGSAPDGWYVGDFNGDGKDDIFRYCPSDHPCGNLASGAQVFLSTGSKFEDAGSWTSERFGSAPQGWYVGDFNGDGKDDILRKATVMQITCNVEDVQSEVLLSLEKRFNDPVNWGEGEFGNAPNGWYVGDFNGDGSKRDDLLRYVPMRTGAEVLISTGQNFDKPEMKYDLAGIVSWAGGCGVPGKYDVYTRVSRYETWIKEQMQSVP